MKDLREKVLRSVSLVVTDRRWAPPLSAMALGFGLFLGVAIGPGASGTFATGSGPIVAVTPTATDAPADEGVAESEPEPLAESEPESETLGSEPYEETYYPETEFTEPEEEPLPEEELPAEEPIEDEEPEGQLLEGTVVHANPAAGSYTMAIAGGELVSIHAPKLPPPGTRLKVEGNPLANNTFGEVSRERSGGSRRADLRGVVTFVDPNPLNPTYTVSGRGSSILVHAGPEGASQLPALGAYATVAVQIEKAVAAEAQPPAEPMPPEAAPTCAADPGLKPPPKPTMTAVQQELEVEPEPATYVDLAGILTAVCPATGQLAISADDLRESARDVVLTVPKRFKTAGLELGDSILATATIGEGGTLTLAGLASDERMQGAEDAGLAQGDLKR